MSKKDDLIYDIKTLQLQIETNKREMQEDEEEQGKILPSTQKRNIELQKELFQAEQELKLEELKEMKSFIKDTKESSTDEVYTDKYNLITLFSEVINNFSEIQNMRYNIELHRINVGNSNLQLLQQDLPKKQDELNKIMQKFQGAFAYYKLNRGIISPDELQSEFQKIMEYKDYGKSEIEESFEDLYSSIYEEKQQAMSKELVQKELPKDEINDIVYLGDSKTKEQLCELYGIENSDDIEIYAINSYSNETYREAYGEYSGAGFEDRLDKPRGVQLGLYYYNKESGQLEPLIDKNREVNREILSFGGQANITMRDGNTRTYTELGTHSYSGLNLTYYRNQSGEMCIARNENGQLRPIQTETLDRHQEIEKEKERISKLNIKGDNTRKKENEQQEYASSSSNQQTNSSSQDDKEKETIEFSEPQDAEDLYKNTEEARRRVGEIFREKMRKNAENTPFWEQEKAEKQEKVDRERIEGRRRFL